MVRLAGDLGLTDDDLNLLYSKYERNGAFNYYAFCKDMDRPFSPTRGRGGTGRGGLAWVGFERYEMSRWRFVV